MSDKTNSTIGRVAYLEGLILELYRAHKCLARDAEKSATQDLLDEGEKIGSGTQGNRATETPPDATG